MTANKLAIGIKFLLTKKSQRVASTEYNFGMTKITSETDNKQISIDRSRPFQLGDWLVEPATDRLLSGEQEVKLEPRVMDLLLCFAEHPGEVLTRERLESSVWVGVVVGYDSLTSAMNKLRKAFNDDPRNAKIFETVAKRGYRLIAPVTHQMAATTGAKEQLSHATINPVPQQRWYTHRSRIIAIVAVIGIAAGLVTTVSMHPVTDNEPTKENIVPRPGIVVLPFINLNDDPAQAYFSDGITDDLIVDLSRISGLFVISRRSAFMYKTRKIDIPSLAKELGVGYVVEGSVRRNGDKLRVNVQLVDAGTGINLWAQRFERNTKDLFDVQDDIRRNIINAMSVTLTEEEQKREQQRYTSNFEAYDYFLRGQSALVKRASANDNRQAQQLMERAIALDNRFARAYAALALIHADAYRFDWADDPKQAAADALRIGKRAVELDPYSPQAHWVLGYIYLFLYKEHNKAIEMGEKTLKLDPNNSDAYTLLGVTHVYNNDPQEAKSLMLHLMKNNNNYPSQVPAILARAYLQLGQYEEALEANDKALLINPTRLQSNVFRVLILYRMGQIEDAKWQVDQLMAMHHNFNAKIWVDRQPYSDNRVNERMLEELKQVGLN